MPVAFSLSSVATIALDLRAQFRLSYNDAGDLGVKLLPILISSRYPSTSIKSIDLLSHPGSDPGSRALNPCHALLALMLRIIHHRRDWLHFQQLPWNRLKEQLEFAGIIHLAIKPEVVLGR